MFRGTWRRLRESYDELFNFEYSDDGIENNELSLYHSNEPHSDSKLPCQFCNVLWNSNLLLSHQISCPFNSINTVSQSVTHPSHRTHGDVMPPARVTGSHRSNNSSPSSTATSSEDPRFIICPITQEIFVHPVLAEDGYTYERSAIEQWIGQHGTSPMTREPLTIEGLRPNRAMSDVVTAYHQRNARRNRPVPQHQAPICYQYELNVDVRKTTTLPFAQTIGKSLFHAERIPPHGSHGGLVLLHITGHRAAKEAELNIHLPSHPHIVRTFGLVKHDGEGMLLLQEHATRGNLIELLRAARQHPTPQVMHHIVLQVVDALIFLTEQRVVHGDLACRNVLVFTYDPVDVTRNLVKLTDFGISRRSNVATSLDIVAVLSAAPELLRSRTYTEKSDVWALAVLAWEIFSKGSTPMIRQANGDSSENSRRILAGERLLRPAACPPAQWAIYLECLKQNPNQRPTFIQLKEKLLRS